MKKLSILTMAVALMLFGFLTISSFAADVGSEHRTNPAPMTPMERETGRVEANQATADRPLRASEVIGKNLIGAQDEKLGEISDLVIGPEGEITFALVSRGGLLGVGSHYTAIPWSAVTRDTQRDELFASVTKQSFDQAPTFSKDEINKMARGDFDAKVYGYYGEGANPGEGKHPMPEREPGNEGSKPMMDKSPTGGMNGS